MLMSMKDVGVQMVVLNLIITGMPSILSCITYTFKYSIKVLNLIITGMPSIQKVNTLMK